MRVDFMSTNRSNTKLMKMWTTAHQKYELSYLLEKMKLFEEIST